MDCTVTADLIRLETHAGITLAPSWPAIASLNHKVAQVMNDLQTLGKSGKNQRDGYTYVTYGDVADTIRTSMATHNLALFAEITHLEQTPIGEKGTFSHVYITFTLADGDTGAMRSQSWIGEAADYGMRDKGVNKAITSAEKYWLMRTFLVSASDDVDPDSDDHKGQPPRAQAPTPAAEPATASAPPAGTPAEPEPQCLNTWANDAKKRAAFWTNANALRLTNPQAHEALNVISIYQYAGNAAQANAALGAFARVLAARAKETTTKADAWGAVIPNTAAN